MNSYYKLIKEPCIEDKICMINYYLLRENLIVFVRHQLFPLNYNPKTPHYISTHSIGLCCTAAIKSNNSPNLEISFSLLAIILILILVCHNHLFLFFEIHYQRPVKGFNQCFCLVQFADII